MIRLSNSATAFLRRGDEYLLMRRAPNREIAPGLWSGIGGKMERKEWNDPLATCLREIQEETGIAAHDIHHLTLRYLIVRRFQDTIRQSYIYFGETNAEPSIETDEGDLFWIHESELLKCTYTETFTGMLAHFLHSPNEGCVMVGIAENNYGKCSVAWAALEDFDPSGPPSGV